MEDANNKSFKVPEVIAELDRAQTQKDHEMSGHGQYTPRTAQLMEA